MKAYLILEDGTVYEGRPAGTPGATQLTLLIMATRMTENGVSTTQKGQ